MNSIEYVEDILPDGLLQIPPALLRHTVLMEESKEYRFCRWIGSDTSILSTFITQALDF